MNDEEKYIRLGLIWSDKGERGFYLLPEDLAQIVNMLEEGIINKNGASILIEECHKICKEISKEVYKLM